MRVIPTLPIIQRIHAIQTGLLNGSDAIDALQVRTCCVNLPVLPFMIGLALQASFASPIPFVGLRAAIEIVTSINHKYSHDAVLHAALRVALLVDNVFPEGLPMLSQGSMVAELDN